MEDYLYYNTQPWAVEMGGSENYYNYYLREVAVGEGITTLGSFAFAGFEKIERISLPTTVTTIKEAAFWGCQSLKKISLPSNLTEIEWGAFAYAGLTEIELPDSVAAIGGTAFCGCPLSEITIPEKVTEISSEVFWGCWQLTKVELPENLTKIGSGAFYYCGMDEVTIPPKVTEIGAGAFTACDQLSQLILPADLTVVDVPDGVSMVKYAESGGQMTITDIVLGKGATEVVIPDEIWGSSVGAVSESLRDMVSAGGHTHKGGQANCVSPASCDICGEKYGGLGGHVLENDRCKFCGIMMGKCGHNASYTLSDTDGDGHYDKLEIHGTGAMAQYSQTAPPWDGAQIKSIFIAEGITSIEGFGGCLAVERVVLPSTVERIGDGAFYNCFSLKQIDLPAGLKSIGDDAFYCTGLADIQIPDGVTEIGSQAFSGCPLTKITIPEGVVRIGMGCFYGCNRLKEVNLPKSLTQIEMWAFYGCTTLKKITLPPDMVSVGAAAFGGRTELTDIVIPEGLSISDRPGTSKITYKIVDDRAVITDIVLGKGQKEVAIPESIYGSKTEIAEELKESIAEIPHRHAGGAATCVTHARCVFCGQEYGMFAGHHFIGGVCSVCGVADSGRKDGQSDEDGGKQAGSNGGKSGGSSGESNGGKNGGSTVVQSNENAAVQSDGNIVAENSGNISVQSHGNVVAKNSGNAVSQDDGNVAAKINGSGGSQNSDSYNSENGGENDALVIPAEQKDGNLTEGNDVEQIRVSAGKRADKPIVVLGVIAIIAGAVCLFVYRRKEGRKCL